MRPPFSNTGPVDDEAEDTITMTPAAFEFVILELKLAETTKEATRLVLVDNMSRKDVRARTGISSDTLSRALKRIAEEVERIQNEEQLVLATHFTLPRHADGLADNEVEILEARMAKKGRKKK